MLLFPKTTLPKPGIWVTILYCLEICIASSKFSTKLRDAFLFISMIKRDSWEKACFNSPNEDPTPKILVEHTVLCFTRSQRSILWQGTHTVSAQQSGLGQNAISPLYIQGTIHLGCRALSCPKRHPRFSIANRERVTSFLDTRLR